jgi:hypothetical protein
MHKFNIETFKKAVIWNPDGHRIESVDQFGSVNSLLHHTDFLEWIPEIFCG